MVASLEESGLNVGNRNMCVCEACRSSIRNSMKARDDGEPFQPRWLKDKEHLSQCCVPSCSSVDIKAEKHEVTWEMICNSLGIGSAEHPGDISLCTKHYQQVYKVFNATSKSDASKSCGVLSRNKKYIFVSCTDPKRVESFLRDTFAFSESIDIEDGDQVCYPCYKFFNQMFKSDVCMLASEDIIFKLKAKKEHLEKIVRVYNTRS